MWQPIETAPRDGNEFLVWMFGNSMAVVYFIDTNEEFPWATMDGPGYNKNAPTHWMPLPAPPEAQ